MLSAIAASSAIGGWVIWQQLSFIWAVVIATSQVLNAVKPQLPYRSRLAALSRLGPDLEALALAAETDWLKVSRGVLTEDETYQLAMNLKRKVQQASQKHFKGSSLPEDQRLLAIADRDVDAYMISFRED